MMLHARSRKRRLQTNPMPTISTNRATESPAPNHQTQRDESYRAIRQQAPRRREAVETGTDDFHGKFLLDPPTSCYAKQKAATAGGLSHSF